MKIINKIDEYLNEKKSEITITRKDNIITVKRDNKKSKPFRFDIIDVFNSDMEISKNWEILKDKKSNPLVSTYVFANKKIAKYAEKKINELR